MPAVLAEKSAAVMKEDSAGVSGVSEWRIVVGWRVRGVTKELTTDGRHRRDKIDTVITILCVGKSERFRVLCKLKGEGDSEATGCLIFGITMNWGVIY